MTVSGSIWHDPGLIDMQEADSGKSWAKFGRPRLTRTLARARVKRATSCKSLPITADERRRFKPPYCREALALPCALLELLVPAPLGLTLAAL